MKYTRMHDSQFLTSRLMVRLAILVMAVAVSTNYHIDTYRNSVFISAFTAIPTPIHHTNNNKPQNIHPNHCCFRINSITSTTTKAHHSLRLPLQSLSTAEAVGCRTISRSQRSMRSNPTVRSLQHNSLSRQQQQQQHDIPRSSSTTMLQSSAIPTIAASSSLFGVAFVSAISAGIFSGGLHAIAGTLYYNQYNSLSLSDPFSPSISMFPTFIPRIVRPAYIQRSRSSRRFISKMYWAAMVSSRSCWSDMGDRTWFVRHTLRVYCLSHQTHRGFIRVHDIPQ